jgi:hypothetical protein
MCSFLCCAGLADVVDKLKQQKYCREVHYKELYLPESTLLGTFRLRYASSLL